MAMDDGEWEMAFDQGYKAGKEAGEFLDPDNETPI